MAGPTAERAATDTDPQSVRVDSGVTTGTGQRFRDGAVTGAASGATGLWVKTVKLASGTRTCGQDTGSPW